MITFILSKLPRWSQAIVLAFIAVLVAPLILPALTVHLHAAATSDVINLFKYTYGTDRMLYLASQEIVMWRILSKKMVNMGGRGQYILPVQIRNAGVFVGHTEGGAKTSRRAQPSSTEAAFSLHEFHYIWDISWKMMQDARKDEYSFARAVDFMDMSMKRRMFRLLNADLCGYGRGELGILASAQNTTSIAVRSLPFTDLGMLVDLMSSADNNTTQGIAAQPITSIIAPTRTVIANAVAGSGTAAGDYFAVADSVRTAGSLHTNGILNWADTVNPAAVVGNLGGINRSTAGNEWWQATVMANGGVLRPLTEDLIMQGMDQCRERGGVVITDFVSNLNLIRRYHESLRADTFFALSAVEKFSGKVGVGRDEKGMKSGENSEGETIYEFSGVPWRAEPFFDANKLLGLNREHIFIGHGENEVPKPISEIFEDMVPFFSSTSNTTFEVIGYWQGQLICDAPTALVRYDDLAET